MAEYYKDANANVYRADGQHVTMGNADPTLDWNKLGLNVDHLPVGSPSSNQFIRSTPVSGGQQTTWDLSPWNASGGQFTQQPILTVNGQKYSYNSPSEYINRLNELKSSGMTGPIDQFIGEFNNVVSSWQSSPVAPPATSSYANNAGKQATDFYKVRVPVTTSNPGGYDIYKADGTKVDYNTFKSLGLNDTWIPEKTLPSAGSSRLPGASTVSGSPTKISLGGSTVPLPHRSGVVGGSDDVRGEYDKLSGDINYGLAQYGITPPDTKMGDEISSAAEIEARRTELKNRQAEDLAQIEQSYAAGKEELKMSQEDAMAKAEGRTRIGGFLTKMETEDLQKMARQQRLELISYEGQHQGALREARRAYEDGDYQLARDKMQDARDIEQLMYQRKQDYFNNVMQFNQMSTPLKRANEAVQNTITGWLSKYPDAFKDIKPSDLLNMTVNDAYERVVNSKSYQDELTGANDILSISDAKALGVPYGTTRKAAMGLGRVPTGSGGGGDFSSTQIHTGAANAGMSADEFRGLSEDTKNYFLNTYNEDVKVIEDDIAAGDMSNEELHDKINSNSSIPQEGKDKLNAYVDEQLPPEMEETDTWHWYNPLSWF